jgi:hypothetical protein
MGLWETLLSAIVVILLMIALSTWKTRFVTSKAYLDRRAQILGRFPSWLTRSA